MPVSENDGQLVAGVEVEVVEVEAGGTRLSIELIVAAKGSAELGAGADNITLGVMIGIPTS